MFGSGGSSFGSSTFGGFNQTPAQPAQSGGLFGNKPAFGATANTFGATPAGTFGATAGTTGGEFDLGFTVFMIYNIILASLCASLHQ